MNLWGIPLEIEKLVRARDLSCVYCHVPFSQEIKPTWEHIDNARWDDLSIMQVNIALCCASCNSSKGAKPLLDWLKSKYCSQKGITAETVGEPIKAFITFFNLL